MLEALEEQGRLLDGFGLGAEAEHVYLALVTRPAAQLAELAAATGRPQHQVRVGLAALAEQGLVQPVGGRYRAREPELAFRNLLARRQRELEEARTSVQRLADVYRRSAPARDTTEIVQVVAGHQALAAAVQDVQESARKEVRALVKPPVFALSAADNLPTQLARMAEGLSYRVVYEQSALSQAPDENLIESSLCSGELMRTAPAVPVKLLLSDAGRALIPLDPGGGEERFGLLIRHPSLIAVVEALFESVWESATPVLPRPDGTPESVGAGTVSARPSPSDLRLLSLLVAGLPDRAVATHLGVSKRTVERRVRRLLDRAGVSTRIQLGLHAAREGWI
ncbi:helix-turn-helix domain-containing protein [Kitasatospora sp. NPDC088351]|uniref:helix-turn-helix transcriptional regulator n=1 Tax=unclassified Kitasatospora TaxID=2633591 RepID=UPI00344A1455